MLFPFSSAVIATRPTQRAAGLTITATAENLAGELIYEEGEIGFLHAAQSRWGQHNSAILRVYSEAEHAAGPVLNIGYSGWLLYNDVM